MPAKRRWIRHITEILTDVEEIPNQVFDRQSIEILFGLRRHAAADLMRDIGAQCIGNALWLDRKSLLIYLNKVALGEDSGLERRRVVKMGQHLQEAKNLLDARRVIIRVEPYMETVELKDVPGVKIGKDQIIIDYFGAEDALRQLFELSKAIANDYTSFQKIAEGIEK